MADLLGLDEPIVRLMDELQRSRLGLYVREGSAGSGDRVALREVLTGRHFEGVCSSGYLAAPGERWLARLLPPPAPRITHHVVFTSPYVITLPGEDEWLAFIELGPPLFIAEHENVPFPEKINFFFAIALLLRAGARAAAPSLFLVASFAQRPG